MSDTPEKKKITPIIINVLIVLALGFGLVRGFQFLSKYKKHSSANKTQSEINSETGLQPIDFEAHRLIADHFCAVGMPDKAIPHYQRILAQKPKNRELRYRFATACLDAGNYAKALKEFSFIAKTRQGDSLTPKIAARRGITLFYLNRITESKDELHRCLEQSPGTAEALCFLGQIEAAGNDSAKAIHYLEKAVATDSTYVEGWYQLARFRMEHGNYIRAQKVLERALEIDPLNGKCHARLGMVNFYLGNKIAAKESYLTAIALNPKDFNSRYNLGELYHTAYADTENALREYNTTLTLNPDHVEANFKVGLVCLRNNMVKESIRYFRTAVKNDPENIRILLQLGVAYEKIGDREKALKVYQKVNSLDALNSIAIQKIKYLSKM